jgi:FHS family L-fucose permease-like MFS transporter
LLCMAIVGGAVLPLIMGQIADHFGLRTAYVVPLVGYVCIAAFGLAASRVQVAA